MALVPALCCPHCRSNLSETGDLEPELACAGCARRFPVIAGIPDLRIFSDPYIDIEADRAKGRDLAAHFADHDFAGLVMYYYSTTSVVPPRDARRYTQGLLGAAARAESAVDAWTRAAPPAGAHALLEIGCGTAPLLVTAARRFEQVVGVDIAFRWLVVAKKRLVEAGVDVPLVCACAEALPFRDARYDVVAADSALETVRDQPQTLAEAHRVLRPGGRLWIATPNRWSLGPDPHVGTWAAGYLPERIAFRRVVREGGIAPRRRLLSLGSLRALLAGAGFAPPRCFVPDVPEGQRRNLPAPLRALVAFYQLVKRLPLGRTVLLLVGPTISAVATRPADAARAA